MKLYFSNGDVKSVSGLPAVVILDGQKYEVSDFGSGNPSPVPEVSLVKKNARVSNPEDIRVEKITRRGRVVYPR